MSNFNPVTRIKVIGVGGGGCNAVNRMLEANLVGVDFYVANTDQQALNSSKCDNRLLLGYNTTHGLGSGGDPNVGRQAALESQEMISKACQDADIVFVATGLGGGTGTGAAPIFAQTAKELGALTIAIVTKPFEWEGRSRMMKAINGLDELKRNVDSVIIIPNDNLSELLGNDSWAQAFLEADNVLRQAVQTITDLVSYNALVNLDFADIKSVMAGQGTVLIGVGQTKASEVENADPIEMAKSAARKAITCPLLEASISGAKNCIVNVTGGEYVTINNARAAVNFIKNEAGNDLDIIFGVAINDSLVDSIIVTVIATGFENAIDEPIDATPYDAPINRSGTPSVDKDNKPEFFNFRNE